MGYFLPFLLCSNKTLPLELLLGEISLPLLQELQISAFCWNKSVTGLRQFPVLAKNTGVVPPPFPAAVLVSACILGLQGFLHFPGGRGNLPLFLLWRMDSAYHLKGKRYFVVVVVLFYFCFIGLHLWHMDLHHSSQQCWILNPLSGAGDGTLILMGTSQAHYH